MINFLPPIKIHCWGGLGSQLFTLSLALDINKTFPKRKIRLEFHSSGVTKRNLELPFIPSHFQVITKDDFMDKNQNNLKKQNIILKVAVRCAKFISGIFGIYTTANNTDEFNRIRPWVLEIRGHYSQREISEYSLIELMKYVNSSTLNELDQKVEVALHYRLGDLLNEGIKNYISAELIVAHLNSHVFLSTAANLDVYSDSLSSAIKLLSGYDIKPTLNQVHCDSLNAIKKLVAYKYFVGTNSKITIWVVLFRLINDGISYNSIPLQLKRDLEINKVNLGSAVNLYYY